VHTAAGSDDLLRSETLVELADRVGEGTGSIDDTLKQSIICKFEHKKSECTLVFTIISESAFLSGNMSLTLTAVILPVEGSLTSSFTSQWFTTVAP